MKNYTKIKGVKEKKQWAVFAPDGKIQFRTISDTKKEAQKRTPKEFSDCKWDDYATSGYTTNRIVLDIKLL